MGGLRRSTGTVWLEGRGMASSGFTVELRPDGLPHLKFIQKFMGNLEGFSGDESGGHVCFR